MSEPWTADRWRSHGLTVTQVRCLRLIGARSLRADDLAHRLGLAGASLECPEVREPNVRKRANGTAAGGRLGEGLDLWMRTVDAQRDLRREHADGRGRARTDRALERFVRQALAAPSRSEAL